MRLLQNLGAYAFYSGVPREASRSLSATTARDWLEGWDQARYGREFSAHMMERARVRDEWCERMLKEPEPKPKKQRCWALWSS